MENNGNLALNNGQLKGLLLKFHSRLFSPLCETFLHLSPELESRNPSFMHLYDLMASYTRVSSFCTTDVPPTFTPKIKPYNPSSPFLWQKYKYISWKNRPLFSPDSITIFYDLSIIFYIGFALNKRFSVSLAKSFLALPLAALCHFPFD